MKKTLIALLALSGLAMGEDVALELTLNGRTGNDGEGYVGAANAMLHFANQSNGTLADGGYMFNGTGQCNTVESTKEGILWKDSTNGICLTLCPRNGAGTSGEVILDSATELIGKEVGGVTLNITSSSSAAITGDVTLTLAVLHNDGTTWSIVEQSTNTLTIGSGSSVALDLAAPVETWGANYKVAAMVSQAKTLSGDNGSPYTLQGITLTANDVVTPVTPPTPAVPEPSTATLSLLALAGLAARRRRK